MVIDRRTFLKLAGTSTLSPKFAIGFLEKISKEIEQVSQGDIGIQYPDEVPGHRGVNWAEPLQGFYETLVDVIFHDKLVDRIQLLKVNPEKYKFGSHNDNINLRQIETWRKDLDALAVINASFYQRSPFYGVPLTPILEKGKYKGRKKYTSNCGVFLAEPVEGLKPKATFVDFEGTSTVINEKSLKGFGYNEAVVSYPTLLDFKGNVRAKKNPTWRATRTFVGMDKDEDILLGNTQGGFFSLNRLGNFLKETKELGFVYALNMDGGPPACMDVKAGNFKYTNYGIWESNNALGPELFYWTPLNILKWKIPSVISVRER